MLLMFVRDLIKYTVFQLGQTFPMPNVHLSILFTLFGISYSLKLLLSLQNQAQIVLIPSDVWKYCIVHLNLYNTAC